MSRKTAKAKWKRMCGHTEANQDEAPLFPAAVPPRFKPNKGFLRKGVGIVIIHVGKTK